MNDVSGWLGQAVRLFAIVSRSHPLGRHRGAPVGQCLLHAVRIRIGR